MCLTRIRLAILAVASMTATCSLAESTSDQVPTDWDLYMLRLVNRARTDPAGENALHGTHHSVTAVAPLAYSPLVGRAAQNHNEWMGTNQNNPAINSSTNTGPAPDSFTHYETLNAQFGGPSGNGSTTGWTGDGSGQRVSFVDYQWGSVAENISWRSNTPTINASLIDANHSGWWNSSGHRSNMTSANYTVFGHHTMNDNDHWATQHYARPLFQPYTHIFGLLFEDKDNSGDWTPLNTNDPQREGLGSIPFDVYPAGGTQPVASGVTLDNGSFAANIGNGTYQVDFSLPGGHLTLTQVAIAGANVDLGDVDALTPPAAACDLAPDGRCDTLDVGLMYQQGNLVEGVAVEAGNRYDLDFDGDIDHADLTAWLGLAAIENGYDTPFLRGDTDDIGEGVARDVDVTDFNQQASYFDPTGVTPFHKEWQDGNFDGDADIDITDFNFLATNFSPTGYGTATATVVPEPSSLIWLWPLAVLLMLPNRGTMYSFSVFKTLE